MTAPLEANAVVGPYRVTWIRIGAPRWSQASLGALAIAASAALVLLLAVGQVARHAVDLGEQRRRATAMHWESTWKCQALREREPRRDCLARLRDPMPGAEAQPDLAATAMTTPGRGSDPMDR